jgi:hypothetical protein
MLEKLKRGFNLKRLVLLCLGYGTFYTIFGVAMKYFLKVAHIPGMELLWYSMLASMPIVLAFVLFQRWPARLVSEDSTGYHGYPIEYKWLIRSGICTGFVIPTTALLYTFGFSVLVAMIIMRGSLIMISLVVDGILIYQGHSTKKVRWQSKVAVGFAMGAVMIIIGTGLAGNGHFNFLESKGFMLTMGFYIIPYAYRIYVLSRFKTKIDNKAIFSIEQVAASVTIIIGLIILLIALHGFGYAPKPLVSFNNAIFNWQWAPILGLAAYGGVAFCSVFIYLYKEGSATFNITLNRMTSLVAGTLATLIAHFMLGQRAVASHEWGALGMVIIAIFFLTWAGRTDEHERNATKEVISS